MILLFLDFNIYVTVSITLIIGVVIGGSVIAHLLKNPEKLERLTAFFNKQFKFLFKSAEYKYIKYDIQSRVNGFVSELTEKVPNLTPTRVKLEWIDEHITPEQFMKSDQLVIRMHKSNNHNRNVINSTFTFVSYSLLRKAKRYIAKYQRDSIDLFVSYKLLENKKFEMLDEFVQQYLQDGLERDKVAEFYDRFFDIDSAGIFFPVFITEMTFLGEKLFGKKREGEKVFEEVKKMVNFLYYYANRRLSEEIISEYNGDYCKFAIRIIGKRFKIDNEGEKVYINNLKKIPTATESIYLIGDETNKKFMDSIVKTCKADIGFNVFNNHKYKAMIKDREGNSFQVKNYLIVLRNEKIAVYHRK